MFRKTVLFVLGALFVCSIPVFAQETATLNKVKAAEAGFQDFKADMIISNPNKKNVQGMGEGYDDILRLQKATINFKSPALIRFDGFAQGVKIVYLQNNYTKLIIAPMIRKKKEVKNEPGQRQDTLDLGFLSSRLWQDNTVTLVKKENNGTVQLKFKPKFGNKDKRMDMVWINPNNLRISKRIKYSGDGSVRAQYVYSDYVRVGKALPVACKLVMSDAKGGSLGTITYKNLKANAGLSNALFSLTQR